MRDLGSSGCVSMKKHTLESGLASVCGSAVRSVAEVMTPPMATMIFSMDNLCISML